LAVPRKLRCQVAGLQHHGEQVYTVDLLPQGLVPAFRPGQFLHLALDEYDPGGFWPDSRVFSIASSPSRRDRLRISYSVRGRFTARMERELAVGRWVWVKLPYGEFVVEDTRDVVLFAGGTGITAFAAFLEGLTPAFARRVYLAYGARSRDLLLYRDLACRRAADVPQFRAFYFVERLEDLTMSAPEGELVGVVSLTAVWPHIESPVSANHYVAGPPAMLAAITAGLRERGVPPEYIKTDAWE
jgi:ferredoxin-NADP reductase